MNEKPIIPPRFEDEFPEEAEVLMKLCGNKELRERTQWQQAKYPKSERIYPHIDDLKLGILGWKYMMFKPKDKSSYKKSIPKSNAMIHVLAVQVKSSRNVAFTLDFPTECDMIHA